MTIGAAPDYVKVQAALYEDGSSSGIPEKIALLVARRKSILETTRELIRRIEKAQAGGTSKDQVIAGLSEWAQNLQPPAKTVVNDTIAHIEERSLEAALTQLRRDERAYAASRP